ncbi:MAG: FHA domain-containing protein [Bacteroidales bacterium]|nr:FHA domain-containing protein [Bacteroidales bacterium]
MKKTFLSILLILITIFSFSQSKRGVVEEIKTTTTGYPEFSFKYNIYNKIQLDKKDFSISENGKIIDFQFSVIPQTETNNIKTILFLWEDMYSHEINTNKRKKYDFIRNSLSGYLENIQNGNTDRYNIATFNRDKNGKLLNFLNNDFTTEAGDILDAVNNYTQSTEIFKTDYQATDLYQAINEGLDKLINDKNSNARALIVFSSGLNMDKAYGSQNEMSPIIQKSLKNEIPIFFICYSIAGTTPKIKALAENSYGQFITSSDFNETMVKLENFANTIHLISNGNTYQFSFITSYPKDGKVHNLSFNVNGEQPILLTFNLPSKTIKDRINENLILFIILIAAVVLIIVGLSVILVISSKKKKAKHNQELLDTQQNMEKIQRLASEESQKNKQQFQDYKNEVEKNKRNEAEKEENQRLADLMKLKNLYPRLQINNKGEKQNYNIFGVITTIGRTNNNDLVISSPTVSKQHAKIVFNGGGFDIIDLQSTNHVIVNGQFVERTILKSGDIIGLGEVVITFYL